MRLTISLLLLCIATSNLMAADIGLVGSQAWTNDDDVGNPAGYGFFVSVPVAERFTILLEYRHFRHQREVLGWTGWFSPDPIEPVPLNSIMMYDSYDADVLAKLWSLRGIDLLIGPGVSINKFELNRESLEVNPARYDHDATRLGLAMSANLSASSIFATPFRLDMSFKAKHVLSDNTYITDSWNPFSDGLGVYEFSLGLAYMFR